MLGTRLHCPIRGPLTVPERAADGLTFPEEKRRIDCIRFLLGKGYPASHFKIETTLLRFGHEGRNSFRTDLAVLDVPKSSISNKWEVVNNHIKLIAEIKRKNSSARVAQETQVYPALNFLSDVSALGVYWDDVEQRLFYRKLSGRKTEIHELPMAVLPPWGHALGSTALASQDLQPSANLLALFGRIEDALHSQIADQSKRFQIMLQLILIKLYDEHSRSGPRQNMIIQDFVDAPLGDADVLKVFNDLLAKATHFYARHLPNPVAKTIPVPGSMLRTISKLLAPIRIVGSKRDVIQDFYMYFAKGVYKWDLAQYFTPTEVVDFIVRLVNPRAGDQIKDPACGSGDFLISSLHHARARGGDVRDAIWGADNSENAVQVSVLNMVLNGDGKSNITREDSLANIYQSADSFSVLLCNPPFGVKIVESRHDVLKKFSLGHEWEVVKGRYEQGVRVRASQETGLLFAELCVVQASPGGRVGIILPNGYLGNRSPKYAAFREWLLRHARLLGVIAFPRFTFKKSGADVSASVVLLEKREKPLAAAIDSENYPFYVGILESVGWSVGDKRAERIYKRDPESGDLVTDEKTNEPVIDADFERILSDFYSSRVPELFPFLEDEAFQSEKKKRGWDVDIAQVLARPDLSIDPKRWCERTMRTRDAISALEHFSLREVLTVVPEGKRTAQKQGLYRYVEIQDMMDGVVKPTPLRGWQLPQRAKHGAEPGDIFVGKIWSSINKWFLAGGNCDGMLVSNGTFRLRMKPKQMKFLPDVIAGLNTEVYRIQARAACTGSDGLAELQEDDLLDIVLPRITDQAARATLQKIVDDLLAGRATVAGVVGMLLDSGQIPDAHVPARSSGWVQV